MSTQPLKPGMLAQIITPPYRGWMVYVHSAAPSTDFNLPDGMPNIGRPPGYWVCESLAGQLRVLTMSGRARVSRYAAIHARHLKPLDPDDGQDEVIRRVGLPNESPCDVIREAAGVDAAVRFWVAA